MKMNPPGMPWAGAVAMSILFGGMFIATMIWLARQLGWL